MTQGTSALILEVAARLTRANVASNPPHDGDSVALDPDEEARLIVAEASSQQHSDPRPLALALCARRETGELLGHLIGRVNFLGCPILTATDCMVPRKETELLARTAIAALRCAVERSSGLPILAIDMCCGAGNLAYAMAHHVPEARVWAADLTEGCCNLTRKNALCLGLEERVTVLNGDLFGAFVEQDLRGRIDLVCCNPPYISSARLEAGRAGLLEHEPREAFDGGPYGLSIHQRVLRDVGEYLRPNGWLMFEIGAGQERQFELLLKRTRSAYGAVQWANDALGRPRVAAVQRLEQGL